MATENRTAATTEGIWTMTDSEFKAELRKAFVAGSEAAQLARAASALREAGHRWVPIAENYRWYRAADALLAACEDAIACGCAQPMSAERAGALNAKDNPPATDEGAQ